MGKLVWSLGTAKAGRSLQAFVQIAAGVPPTAILEKSSSQDF